MLSMKQQSYIRAGLVLGVGVCALSVQLTAVQGGPSGAQEPTETPEVKAARTTFESVCSTCHDAATATTTLRTRQEWAEVLEMMVGFGATATDDQFAQIQRYLARRYGKVNVNRAPADELMLVLDVPADVAQAILDKRTTMRLTTVDDLKDVPGMTAAKLAAIRVRLQF